MNGRTNTTSVTEVVEGVQVPLEAPTNLSIAQKDSELWLSWTDPVDKVASPGGEMVAEWNHTIIVRRDDRVPTSPTDGIEVTRETMRNQYSSPDFPYIDSNLENGVTYYYAVYAYSTIGVVSEAATGSVAPRNAKVEYYKTLDFGWDTFDDEYNTDAGCAASLHHFLIAGGYDGDRASRSSVYCFDQNLTKTVGTNMVRNVCSPVGGSLNGYAFLLGGDQPNNYPDDWGYVNFYSSELTHSSDYGSGYGRIDAASATVPGKIIFSGGYSEGNELDTAISFTTSLTSSELTNLPRPLRHHAGATNGTHAIFAGGLGINAGYDTNNQQVYAYSESLTLTTLASLSGYYTTTCGGASVNGRAIFAGGEHYNTAGNDSYRGAYVDSYDQSLTKQVLSNLSSARGQIGSASMDGYAVFGGGHINGSLTNVTDVYDSSFTRTTGPTLPLATRFSFFNATGTIENGKIAMFMAPFSMNSWGGINSLIVQ